MDGAATGSPDAGGRPGPVRRRPPRTKPTFTSPDRFLKAAIRTAAHSLNWAFVRLPAVSVLPPPTTTRRQATP
ncbi:protein of unknown function [Streptantibioticus cattleyicolor NRRL 8057 = DSM 46488]|nr:protein of unknown function [Streptantibioticus cattleyicolor NRRL 8057 = DSM 46488]